MRWNFNNLLALLLTVGIVSVLAVFVWFRLVPADAFMALMGPLLTMIVVFYFRKAPPGASRQKESINGKTDDKV